MSTITSTTRFAYASTNQPTQTPTGLVIHTPTQAEVTGLGWKQLRDQYRKDAKLNISHDWVPAVWVGGKLVASGVSGVGDLIMDLEIGS